MRPWVGCAPLALAVAACVATPPRRGGPVLAPTGQSVPQLAAAIADDSRRSEQEHDAAVRAELAAAAGRDAAACMALEPHAAACLYGRALAMGLEARAHPIHAGEALNAMLADLSAAEAVDPGYDEAGPARVQALVLTRAPGWPLGPGDSEAAVAAARRAATLRPEFPPNLLALAEALAKNGDPVGAQDGYQRAREAALALPACADQAAWLRETEQALRRK